jgi:hypothetical protein
MIRFSQFLWFNLGIVLVLAHPGFAGKMHLSDVMNGMKMDEESSIPDLTQSAFYQHKFPTQHQQLSEAIRFMADRGLLFGSQIIPVNQFSDDSKVTFSARFVGMGPMYQIISTGFKVITFSGLAPHPMTAQDANAYCSHLGGNVRLPTFEDYSTLVHALRSVKFNAQSLQMDREYWTSSLYSDSQPIPVAIDKDILGIYVLNLLPNPPGQKYNVRCVVERSGSAYPSGFFE